MIQKKNVANKLSVAFNASGSDNKKKMFADDDDGDGLQMVNPMQQQQEKKKMSPKRKTPVIQSNWASAVDPNSGKLYYYNTETHETRWTKPTT